MENSKKKRLATFYTVLLVLSYIQRSEMSIKEFYTTHLQQNSMNTSNHYLTENNSFTFTQSTITYNRAEMDQTEQGVRNEVSDQTITKFDEGHFMPDTCNRYGSCYYQSKVEKRLRYCQCDDVCFKYNDCCYDANVTYIDVNGPYECASPKTHSNQLYGYFIVRQCLSQYKSSKAYYLCKSKNITSTGPWVISKENVIYQNRFCAECNGVTTFTQFAMNISNVSPTALTTISDGKISFNNLINSSTKVNTEMIPPPDVFIRSCLLYQLPNSEYADKCNSYSISAIKIYHSEQIPMRNKFCAHVTHDSMCFDPLSDDTTVAKDLQLYPLSIVFSFGNERTCGGENSGECQKNPLSTGYPLEEDYYFYLKEPITSELCDIIVTLLVYSLSDFVQIAFVSKIRFYEIWIGNNIHFILMIRIYGKITLTLEIPEMTSLVQRMSNFKWFFSIRRSNKIILEINSVVDNTDFNAKDLKWEYAIDPFYYQKQMSDKGITTKQGSATVQNFRCQQQQIECSLNGESRDTYLTIDSIQCLKFVSSEKFTSVLGTVKIILTYTGMSVSVVALGVSIVVYRITNMYTSIPGSIVQSLFISLFVSNILFMTGIGATDNQVACYCIGVCLHYFWLLVFAFKSVALVHMTHTIRTVMNNSAHTTSRRSQTKLKLNILCLTLPLIFVAPGIVFDNLNFYNIRVEYNNKVCFPTGFPGNIFFVSIPIGLSVVTNMFCLGIVAATIKQQSLGTQFVRKSNSFRFISVYVRISVVTGMFWISGILGSFFNDVVTELIFIILCSFQGLFVSLSYVSSQKVVKQIREKSSSKTVVTATEKF